jgi:peptidoglycan glycosyltransferase
MRSVVNSPNGTDTAAAIPGVQVAGKTGTAQAGTGKINAWFVAFAQVSNPQIAVAVVLPNQPGANEYQGGTLADANTRATRVHRTPSLSCASRGDGRGCP